MSIKCREFLLLLGESAGAVALSSLSRCDKKHTLQQVTTTINSFLFQPIKGAIPLETSGFKPEQQKEIYSTHEVVDNLVLAKGFQYQVLTPSCDKVDDSRFGYNNDYSDQGLSEIDKTSPLPLSLLRRGVSGTDGVRFCIALPCNPLYLSFVATTENEGYLLVNFEYISAIPWMQTYQQVIGKLLPFAEVKTALKNQISDRLKNQASESREFLVINTTYEKFMQTCRVPIGSNWFSKTPNSPPKPAVVALTKSSST